tara:strand:- start:8622 stop:8774 length:153 start_codon:yes stop_codon:yes gene_type:complete
VVIARHGTKGVIKLVLVRDDFQEGMFFLNMNFGKNKPFFNKSLGFTNLSK